MLGPPHPVDVDLIAQARAGNRGEIDRLVSRLGCVPRILARFNQRMGGCMAGDDLRDMTQDVLVEVWRRLDDYDGQAPLEAWVYGFCYHAFMNATRKRQRRGRMEGIDDVGDPEGSGADVLDYGFLYRGLESLDGSEAQVIRMKHFGELTFDQIGERLELSPNTAKTTYYRGIRRLAERLKTSEDGWSR